MERHHIALSQDERDRLRCAYCSPFYRRLMEARTELYEAWEAIDEAMEAYETTKART